MSAGVDTNNNKNKNKTRAKKSTFRIDMAPMCDLGFLLITFFMFTTTFSKPNILQLNMPSKALIDPNNLPTVKNNNSLTIILGKDNKIYYHQQELASLTPSNLIETDYSKNGIRTVILNAAKNADQDKFTVIIKPTNDSNYKNLVDLLDEMQITNSERFSVGKITQQETDVYKQKQNN